MAKKMTKMSRNATRKTLYAGMGSEHDKESRNSELSNALGAADLKVPDVVIEKELLRDKDGKVMLDPMTERPVRVERRKVIEKASVADKVSHIETRAGKRARLKASKRKTVREGKHLKGACHNIGCRQCAAQWAPMPSTARKPRYTEQTFGKRPSARAVRFFERQAVAVAS